MNDADMIIDLGQDEPESIERTSGGLIPAGYYKAFAKQADFAKSARKQTPSVHIEWMIEEPVEYKRRVVWDDLWLTNLGNPEKPFNMNRIKTVLKAVGKPYMGTIDIPTLVANIEKGGYIIIKVDIEYSEQYDDKNRVVGYRALDNKPEQGIGVFPDQPKPKAKKSAPPSGDGDVVLEPDIELEEDDPMEP